MLLILPLLGPALAVCLLPITTNARRAWSDWALPFVVIMLSATTALHYLTGAHFLPYHSIYRSLYYLPISVAAITWGVRGGLVTALLTTALYLPHVLLMGEMMPGGILDNILEVVLFSFVAVLAGWLADAQRRQRRQAETLRAYITDILTSLPVGVVTVDAQGLLDVRNPAAGRLLDGVRQADVLPTRPGYYERLFNGTPVGLHATSLRGTDGAPVGQVLVLEDLSEQRRLAEQVRQAQQLAALGQLAGGLAHEVRNPLAIVRATAQLLAGRLTDQPQLQTHLGVLTAEADRIDRLISELLNYARPQPLQQTRIFVATLLDDLARSCTSYAQQHGIRLTTHAVPPSTAVVGDYELLRQALMNLALNALQASPDEGVVELGYRTSPTHVCFTVRDSGPGIPTEVRERMFDPFFTTRDDGTGMGLAVVARIVADHGGRVAYENAEGGGTIVCLCLPKEGA